MQGGLDELREDLAALGLPPETAAWVQFAADGIRSWIVAGISALASGVAAWATIGILTVFLTFFVLRDGAHAWEWLLQSTPAGKRERIEASSRDALERVGGYLRGTAILSAALAAAYGAFLVLLGVPTPGLLAVVVFLGGFVPYLGNFVAMVVLLLVALSTVGPQTTLILLILMMVAHSLLNNLLRPVVYGRSVHLHPALVLIALPVGAAMAGIVGLFAAIPVTAVGVALGGATINALEPDPEAYPDVEVSGWVDRLAQWSWRVLAALGVAAVAVFVVAQAPLVVIPIVLAGVIAATVVPLAGRLRSRGWGGTRAALAATGGAFAAILVVVILAVVALAPPIAEAIGAAIDGGQELSDGTDGALGWVGTLAQTFGVGVLRAISAVVSATGAMTVVLILSALLSFYFLRDLPIGWRGILQRARSWRRAELDTAGRDAVDILGSYMFGTAAISAVGAVAQFLIMVILGIPYALPVAILSFFACFIPYVGGFVTTGLAFLLTVAVGSQSDIVIMFVYTIVINIVQGNIVTPLVYKAAVNLHPAVVLLAIPAGGAVAGIAGMFLAVPFLAVVAATWRPVLRLLGDEPPRSGVSHR